MSSSDACQICGSPAILKCRNYGAKGCASCVSFFRRCSGERLVFQSKLCRTQILDCLDLKIMFFFINVALCIYPFSTNTFSLKGSKKHLKKKNFFSSTNFFNGQNNLHQESNFLRYLLLIFQNNQYNKNLTNE